MNKIADAVSMNLPALTEHSAGLAEFLEDGQDVFCCDPKPESIADGLQKALEDKSRLKKMAQGLEEIYEIQFSPNAYYKRLNEILK